MKTTGYLKAVIVTWVIFVVSGSVVWGAAGDILWKFETVYSIEGTPAIADDGTIYFGLLNNNYVYALNPAGTLEWKYKVVVKYLIMMNILKDLTRTVEMVYNTDRFVYLTSLSFLSETPYLPPRCGVVK